MSQRRFEWSSTTSVGPSLGLSRHSEDVGNNRDYRTRDHLIRYRLSEFDELNQAILAAGVDPQTTKNGGEHA